MTPPPPITFAGRDSASTGHRRGLRRKPSQQAPRRVSGPTGGRAAATAPARSSRTAVKTSRPAPAAAPARPAPRRAATSTARGAAATTTVRRAATTTVRRATTTTVRRPLRSGRSRSAAARQRLPLGARALAYVRALPDHRLIDRLIHGRAWIPVLGLLLTGIVAMQVEVLKLNASMGRAIETSSALQSRNELLRESVAALGDDQRIERLATAHGMVMPAPDAPSFISARGDNVQRALANIHAPDPAAFTAALPVAGAVTIDTTGAITTTGTTSATPTAGTTATTPTIATTAPTDPAATTATTDATATTATTATTAATAATGATGATAASTPTGAVGVAATPGSSSTGG
jgi:hypothetical protein